MTLPIAQQKLLQQLQANAESGLTTDQATARREQAGHFNVVDPPIKCPAWICCLLPCIKHVPSMKVFAQLKPDDAEVLRNGRWIRYDAASLVTGDVIRLEAGDIVPADCVVLQPIDSSKEDATTDFLVDMRNITGQDKPRSNRDADDLGFHIYYGGTVVQGTARGVVTAVGPNTLLASLIREGRFPPKGEIVVPPSESSYTDDDDGIALVSRETV